MHQLHAADAPPGVAERLDEAPGAGRGGVHARIRVGRLGLVGVVDDADGDPGTGALAQRTGNDRLERIAQPKIVDRHVEALPRTADEIGQPRRHLGRVLLALRQEKHREIVQALLDAHSSTHPNTHERIRRVQVDAGLINIKRRVEPAGRVI